MRRVTRFVGSSVRWWHMMSTCGHDVVAIHRRAVRIPMVPRKDLHMADEMAGQTLNPTPNQPMNKIDPNAHLRPQMRVLGAQGKQLGKIESIDQDASSGQLSSLVIRHGLFNSRLTTVPGARVKWVNSDSVILDLSPAAFKRLP